MRIGALVPNSGALPIERGIPQMAAALEAAGVHVALGERPHRAAGGDRLVVPVRGGRQGDVAVGDAVLRRDGRARADRRRDRARDDRHRGARAAAPAAGRAREAGGVDRRRERRPAAPRRRRRLAEGGVRRAQRPVRRPQRPARRVDGDRARLLDGRPAGAARASATRCRPGRSACPTPGAPDPVPDGRPLARRAPARGAARRRLARPAVARARSTPRRSRTRSTGMQRRRGRGRP